MCAFDRSKQRHDDRIVNHRHAMDRDTVCPFVADSAIPQSAGRATRQLVGFFPRRLAIKLAVAFWAIVWDLRFAWGKKIAISLRRLPKLKRIGGFVIVKIKGRPLLLIRTDTASIAVVHAICPHQKTLLSYSDSRRLVICSKHGSRFSLAGQVLKGPAKKNLRAVYRASFDKEKNRIIIALT